MILLIAFLIPILFIFSAVVMYRFSGRREIFKMDLIQFIYSFILAPAGFVWLKSFVYVILKNELGSAVTLKHFLFFDTFISTVFLYVFIFIIIHSLTKSFHLNQQKNPWQDVQEIVDYFHMDFSHMGVYFGLAILSGFLSSFNALLPLPLSFSHQDGRSLLYGVLLFALLFGIVNTFSVYNYNSTNNRFLKTTKLLFAILFLIDILFYFTFDISFSYEYLLFWFIFASHLSTVSILAFSERRDVSKKIPFKINLHQITRYLPVKK